MQAKSPLASHAASPSHSVIAKSNARRVLIVDDHPLVRAGLSTVINQEPDLYVCGEAGTAHDALDLVRHTQADIVIVDLTLPDGTGLDLVKRLAKLPGCPRLLVCSIHEEALFAERALAAGASGYIHKAEATTLVVTAIRKVLSGSSYLSENVTQTLLHQLSGRPAKDSKGSVENLTPRELQVFMLIGKCLSASKIGEQLHLSVKTIETHRAKIKRKLNLATSGELTRYAVQWVLEQH
ncbi:response regulator containing a CheY-like receiver domain and an HTH DNA-binding domain [Thiorhodovibrio frisius]|uniref:Response regulator containing a CheY-like receiver domain and an HTH DNA-binding domain n=1 Tax=Thiorhodovibrio frisius TaxID=631362 RepID=H8Z073_9GAMM|nr:response regulator containing a CheY-like receiver domain and an HTH DNA-binding domain [Thiorhodovibrio frisius]WPL24576.1 Response regulator UvrY [Thiorhodovibrio frisius]